MYGPVFRMYGKSENSLVSAILWTQWEIKYFYCLIFVPLFSETLKFEYHGN